MFLPSAGGWKVQRPYVLAVQGIAANDLLQLVYIEMALADKTMLFCFAMSTPTIVGCFHSSTRLRKCRREIIAWCSALGVPSSLMSDGPTHFKNEKVRLVDRRLRVPPYFTFSFTPWSNSGIERLGKE